MSKRDLRNVLGFLIILMLRWWMMKDPLPSDWMEDKEVKIKERIVDIPQVTETQTVVRTGLINIRMKGYRQLHLGEVYKFRGKLEREMWAGKTVQLIMRDPKVELCDECKKGYDIGEEIRIGIAKMRQKLVSIWQTNLPEPHGSLAAGILLGTKAQMPDHFYQDLIQTGTLHVIAASGYNVAVVARAVLVPLGMLVPRAISLAGAMVGVATYVLLAGASASVVRAAIMGCLTLGSYYLGREAQGKRLLWFTAALMVLISPTIIVEVGFGLSIAATAGILYGEPLLRRIAEQRLGIKHKSIQAYLSEFVYPTLAATLATMPVILWNFGRISWLTPLANAVILPVIPLVMFLAAISLVFNWVPYLGDWSLWLLYVPLEYIVSVISKLGH